MGLHRFETVQTLPVGLAAAWDFFSDPKNLAVITPPEMSFEVTSPLPERVYAGLMVTYRVRPLLRIPVQWVTEITHVDEGRYFVDEQRLGPYRVWHHEHHFSEVAGGIEMRDIVHYAVPLGPLGDVLDRLVIGKRVEEIFAFRRRVLERRFGQPIVR
ncbi:MAG: SRPBCC family protein [Chloroflexi bacterium]|nr:SRPBCC family protein [Chloroflexota bacterium]MDA1145307.1 SRPBCC family protein [Chloroflexota bacterium]